MPYLVSYNNNKKGCFFFFLIFAEFSKLGTTDLYHKKVLFTQTLSSAKEHNMCVYVCVGGMQDGCPGMKLRSVCVARKPECFW